MFLAAPYRVSIRSRSCPLKINAGRPGGIRTPSIRFWRPALYQLELLACTLLKGHQNIVADLKLFRLLMHGVMPASGTEFFHFEPLCRLLFVLVSRVVSLFAVGALHCNDIAHKPFLLYP